VPHPVLVSVGALVYGGILAVMGDFALLPKLFKAAALVGLMAWFSYFWVVLNLSWFAFIPLAPVFILLKIQGPKIKASLNQSNNEQ